jgi:2-polyprenyl-6-methoxyphenol hydroxylase-like FAD-dependent oxidoreductase
MCSITSSASTIPGEVIRRWVSLSACPRHRRQAILIVADLLHPVVNEGVRAEMPLQLTSWHAIFRTLRAAFPGEFYHAGSTLSGFDQAAGCVVAHFADRSDITTDVLVVAEGSRSEIRRRLMSMVQPKYAGYVAWRGTIDEEAVPPALVRFFDQSFTICEGRSGVNILSYVIPGVDEW